MRGLALLPFVCLSLALLGCGATASDSDHPGQGAASGESGPGSGGAGSSGSGAGSSGAAPIAAGGAGAAAGAGGSPAHAGAAAGAALERGAIASVGLGSCAIGLQSQVACWGVYPNMPGMFEPPAGAFTRVAGGSFLCAQDASGKLSCFRQPASGEPLDGAPTTPVVDFDIGVSAMCWLDAQGNVSCSLLDYPAPTDVKLSRVSVGRSFACGIRLDDAGITCWGDDGKGSAACGTIPATGQLEPPTGSFTEIDANVYNTCALRTDGTVACWGAGDATDDPNAIFCDEKVNFGQSVPPTDRFTQISVGESHACGVKTDGTLACWGAGTQKGDCTAGIDQCGQAAPPPGSFVQVAAGRTHSCAMHADRTVECWGSNTGGRATPPATFP